MQRPRLGSVIPRMPKHQDGFGKLKFWKVYAQKNSAEKAEEEEKKKASAKEAEKEAESQQRMMKNQIEKDA